MVYTAGNLRRLYYVNESSYGIIPTGALSWAGEIESLKPLFDPHAEEHYEAGSQAYSTKIDERIEAGFNVKCTARALSGGIDWTTFWATYAFGSASGFADALPSFTAQVGKLVGSTTYNNFYNGCKPNKFILSAERPGAYWIFEEEVFAQYLAIPPNPASPKVLTGLQNVTVGANPSDISTAFLTFAAPCQLNLGGGGLADIYFQKVSLTIDRNIQRELGHRLGDDANQYSLTTRLNEGRREITFHGTLIYADETYVNAKKARTAVTALTIPVGAKTITLSNGYFPAKDMPENKQDLMDEEITIRFPTGTIA